MHSPPLKKVHYTQSTWVVNSHPNTTINLSCLLFLFLFLADDILDIDMMAVKIEAVPVFLFIIGLVC